MPITCSKEDDIAYGLKEKVRLVITMCLSQGTVDVNLIVFARTYAVLCRFGATTVASVSTKPTTRV